VYLSPTAAVIALAGLIAAYSGAELVLFSQDFNRVAEFDFSSEASCQVPTCGLATRSFVENWKDTPGVGDMARTLSLSLARAQSPENPVAVEAAGSEIVGHSPTWAAAWQDLAEARMANGAEMQSVLAAFHMSDITGSHYVSTMVRRAVFGLEHWADLPDVERQIVVRDVARTAGDPNVKPRYRTILEQKPESERDEIRLALTKSGLDLPEVTQGRSD
jgi:hypothetical protein